MAECATRTIRVSLTELSKVRASYLSSITLAVQWEIRSSLSTKKAVLNPSKIPIIGVNWRNSFLKRHLNKFRSLIERLVGRTQSIWTSAHLSNSKKLMVVTKKGKSNMSVQIRDWRSPASMETSINRSAAAGKTLNCLILTVKNRLDCDRAKNSWRAVVVSWSHSRCLLSSRWMEQLPFKKDSSMIIKMLQPKQARQRNSLRRPQIVSRILPLITIIWATIRLATPSCSRRSQLWQISSHKFRSTRRLNMRMERRNSCSHLLRGTILTTWRSMQARKP